MYGSNIWEVKYTKNLQRKIATEEERDRKQTKGRIIFKYV